jgi:hypothetical protein
VRATPPPAVSLNVILLTVRLGHCAYSTVLRKASLPAGTRIPWMGNRAIHYELS